MEPVSPWHANIGDILSRIFNEGARGRFRLRVQYPINLGQMSQPQPDLVLGDSPRNESAPVPGFRHALDLQVKCLTTPPPPLRPGTDFVPLPRRFRRR
jgi:hypothetical protein